MKSCDFLVLDGNYIGLALVFIRVGAKCGNDDFCVEIVAREWVLCYFNDFAAVFNFLRHFTRISRKTAPRNLWFSQGFTR